MRREEVGDRYVASATPKVIGSHLRKVFHLAVKRGQLPRGTRFSVRVSGARKDMITIQPDLPAQFPVYAQEYLEGACLRADRFSADWKALIASLEAEVRRYRKRVVQDGKVQANFYYQILVEHTWEKDSLIQERSARL